MKKENPRYSIIVKLLEYLTQANSSGYSLTLDDCKDCFPQATNNMKRILYYSSILGLVSHTGKKRHYTYSVTHKGVKFLEDRKLRTFNKLEKLLMTVV